MTYDRTKQRTILCIEDDLDLLEELREELIELGYSVLSVDGPEAAERLLGSATPDLILCDIVMPNQNGIDFLTSMRARGKIPSRTPFLFLSAIIDRDTRLQALGEGAADYLFKPVDLEVLHLKIENLIDLVDRAVRGDEVKAVEDLVHLSRREEQVLELIGEGARTASIAFDLGLSEHTVNQYIKEVYRKLGVTNRAGAVRQAIARGLVSPNL